MLILSYTVFISQYLSERDLATTLLGFRLASNDRLKPLTCILALNRLHPC